VESLRLGFPLAVPAPGSKAALLPRETQLPSLELTALALSFAFGLALGGLGAAAYYSASRAAARARL
ncbi:MAG TPA: hypothetical protein DEP35_01925, partial [Deltaproteobacteria bacterium]|nr:hypothetical protein [Deltaproteobacteria bacterium]